MYFIDFFITHLYWLVWHSLLNENLASILLQQYLHNIILTSYGNFSKCDMPAAAAAAKSLQSCPTLCDPIDGSPPGSAIPGILQARTLEWVAISFSNAWKWKVKVKSLSRVRSSVTPWTAAFQAPSSMGFSRQEYWSGVPLPSLDMPAICIQIVFIKGSNSWIPQQTYWIRILKSRIRESAFFKSSLDNA